MKKVEELTKDAIKNIEEDRDNTKLLLQALINELAAGQHTHIEAGAIAAKFMETLQRSNEQLVKLVGILSKQKTTVAPFKLNDDEKENLFNMIEGAKE